MGSLHKVTRVLARQIAPDAVIESATAAAETAIACDAGNEFDGRIGVRVSAIFVILVGSLFGRSTRWNYSSCYPLIIYAISQALYSPSTLPVTKASVFPDGPSSLPNTSGPVSS